MCVGDVNGKSWGGNYVLGIVEYVMVFFFFFQAEDGIRDTSVTGVQTCALPFFYIVFFSFYF